MPCYRMKTNADTLTSTIVARALSNPAAPLYAGCKHYTYGRDPV